MFFVNNFCGPEIFLRTQKETMVTQISAALPSASFHSGKSYVKKITMSTFCANFPCKIEKFELKVVGVGILGKGFCFQGSH